jgi:general secretion pathway protein D
VTLRAQVPPPPANPVPAPGTGNPALIARPAGTMSTIPSANEQVYGKDEINLKEMDINQFLSFYSQVVGRTILRPATLPAPTITIRNETPLTRTEAIQMLDAVLAINGIAIIPFGEKFAKALPVGEANTGGGRVNEGLAKDLPELGQYVTHVAQLKFVKPSEMVTILQPFSKVPNSILHIDANGILVIRDYAENVKRMLEMIERVDINVPAEFISEVIPIKYALAGDIASALNSLGGGGSTASVGSSSGGGSSARSSGARGGGRSLGGGMGMGVSGGNYGNQPGMGGVGGVGGVGSVGGLGSTGGAAAGGGTFTDRLRSIINKASTTSGSGDIQIFGQTKIIADERTNSLLIYATRQDMDTIKDVISKLDVVLAQVLIESIILGVSGDSSLEYGVSAAQKTKNLGNNAQGAGVMNNNNDFLGTGQSFLQNVIVSNAASAVPSLGGLNYFGKINDDWLVAVKALSSSGKAEVIQRPTIMTTHATPGRFFVGNTVPYITSTYNYGYTSGASSSYSQLRVGIQLDVTPFINPDGIVVMKIDQAIEEIDRYVQIDGNDVPQTASRTLSADITVRNRDTIVLGGFIRSLGSKTKSGVPLLKDVPVLGALFRSTSTSKERRELLVLMRPTVLSTPELAALGSDIERERMTGINKFSKQLEKENQEFEKMMDDLDGKKPSKEKAATNTAPALLQP